MTEGTAQSIEIDASPEEIFAVAVEIERYPEWASGVSRVEVLERDEQERPLRAAFELEGFVKKISYELTYSYDQPTRMSWVADPNSDLDLLEGSYTFTETDGATEVVYVLRVKPNFPIPGFIRRQAEKQIVSTALRGLRQQVEA
ncbi:MAG: cyclase [Acidimicrobiia bacterium]|nr:cyclase [Acidimicrobiia bacterium]